jgi:hypothetical protein
MNNGIDNSSIIMHKIFIQADIKDLLNLKNLVNLRP